MRHEHKPGTSRPPPEVRRTGWSHRCPGCTGATEDQRHQGGQHDRAGDDFHAGTAGCHGTLRLVVVTESGYIGLAACRLEGYGSPGCVFMRRSGGPCTEYWLRSSAPRWHGRVILIMAVVSLRCLLVPLRHAGAPPDHHGPARRGGALRGGKGAFRSNPYLFRSCSSSN